MAQSTPCRVVRSWRAPIWVCRAPMLKSTLPFSKAKARCWDGTPVNESYLERGGERQERCRTGGKGRGE